MLTILNNAKFLKLDLNICRRNLCLLCPVCPKTMPKLCAWPSSVHKRPFISIQSAQSRPATDVSTEIFVLLYSGLVILFREQSVKEYLVSKQPLLCFLFPEKKIQDNTRQFVMWQKTALFHLFMAQTTVFYHLPQYCSFKNVTLSTPVVW